MGGRDSHPGLRVCSFQIPSFPLQTNTPSQTILEKIKVFLDTLMIVK